MHHTPASATSVKIILDISAPAPPKSQETISNPKRPILPQLNAPIITSKSAILSSMSSVPMAQLASELENIGKDMGLSIRIQREDIFEAMHRI